MITTTREPPHIGRPTPPYRLKQWCRYDEGNNQEHDSKQNHQCDLLPADCSSSASRWRVAGCSGHSCKVRCAFSASREFRCRTCENLFIGDAPHSSGQLRKFRTLQTITKPRALCTSRITTSAGYTKASAYVVCTVECLNASNRIILSGRPTNPHVSRLPSKDSSLRQLPFHFLLDEWIPPRRLS